MKPARAIIAATVALATVVGAAPHKVLVLPLDGDADAAVRAKLDATVGKLAHELDGQVSAGNTTFSETAAAVGCDPSAPACADTVLSTMSVDEVVWGSATTVNGQTTVVVRRAAKTTPTREVSATVAPGHPPGKLETALGPMFGLPGPAGSDAGSAAAPESGSAAPPPQGSDAGSAASPVAVPSSPPVDEHDRNLGLGLAIGGGLAFVVGLALWASESSLQSDIDQHSTKSIDDVHDLTALEDRAGNYALAGNVLVVAGLVAGGFGAYYLYKHHQRRHPVIAPAPVDQGTGATLVIGGRW